MAADSAGRTEHNTYQSERDESKSARSFLQSAMRSRGFLRSGSQLNSMAAGSAEARASLGAELAEENPVARKEHHRKGERDRVHHAADAHESPRGQMAYSGRAKARHEGYAKSGAGRTGWQRAAGLQGPTLLADRQGGRQQDELRAPAKVLQAARARARRQALAQADILRSQAQASPNRGSGLQGPETRTYALNDLGLQK